MHESDATLPGVEAPAPPAATTTARPGLSRWLADGLRASVLLRPRMAGYAPTPLQLLAVALAVALLELALGRLEVVGPAVFDLRGWLSPWWSTAVTVWLAWWLFQQDAGKDAGKGAEIGVEMGAKTSITEPGMHGGASVTAWLLLWLVATLPVTLVSQALSAVSAHGLMPPAVNAWAWLGWSIYIALWLWMLGVAVQLARAFLRRAASVGALAAGLIAVSALSAWQFPDRPWQIDYAQREATDKPRLRLSQQSFETQVEVWQKAAAALAPERPGVTDVYGLVFAPYAAEDVFLRESTLVAGVLAERFDAAGRVLHLVNHASTVGSHAWATPQNLERAINTLATRMDRGNDVLVVYLTSHGAQDFKLAASHWPLEVDPMSPLRLREALDAAGIRNRVLVVSACYSGGWIEPMATDTTLVMTAADATHTSYGCGRLSELTFFGRALFDEQLRKTHSFEQAFAAAVPVIRQRETEAGKSDGFSNPQIRVGEQIRPILQELERRLATPPKVRASAG